MLPSFEISNAALAVALATGGVPVPVDERGRPNAQAMLYSIAMLRRMGYTGMTADQAAQKALRDGKPGVRLFFFQGTTEAAQIVKAFNQAHAMMQEGKDIHMEDMMPAHIGCYGYAYNQMRQHMLSAFNIPAFIVSDEVTSSAKTPDGGWKASGNFSAISVGASDKLKSEVRL